MKELITYEQPINELMRSCLRLEFLFKRVDYYLENFSIGESTEIIMDNLMDILNLLERPDLKSKLAQEFHRHVITFSRLSQLPNVNQVTLEKTLKQLEQLMTYFLHAQGKIAQALKDDPFIASIRTHFNSPGDCYIDSPMYVYWLNQSEKLREQQIHVWIDSLTQVRSAIDILLRITRESTVLKEVSAMDGFYHQNLNPETPCQLIRVEIPKNLVVYPEISAGKHRMSIRFVSADALPPKQSDQTFEFYLACCSI
jgi:cell division protein ZapD